MRKHIGNRTSLSAPDDIDVTSDVMNSHRADLVPVYSFGENELFQQVIFPDGSLGRRLQDLVKKIMGYAPCLFVGQHMAVLPFRIPITIVGECPITEYLTTSCNLRLHTLTACFFYFSGKPDLSAKD